jgi:hypothetical protein
MHRTTLQANNSSLGGAPQVMRMQLCSYEYKDGISFHMVKKSKQVRILCKYLHTQFTGITSIISPTQLTRGNKKLNSLEQKTIAMSQAHSYNRT